MRARSRPSSPIIEPAAGRRPAAAPAGATPLVSVITPVRNGARFLESAIASVQEQSLQSFEHIIVDGASTDGSRQIGHRWSARDSRVLCISEPDRGLYDALFKGFERATAPVCCWINADDRLMPWALELAVRTMAATGARWISGVPAAMDADGLVHTIDDARWYPRRLLRAGLFHARGLGFLQQEGTVFARSLVDGLGPEARAAIRSSRQAGDFLLWTRFARSDPLYLVPTVLGAFRQHGGNLTHDLAPYLEELRQAGHRVPPAAVGALLRAAWYPLACIARKRRLRDWRTVAERLPPLAAIAAEDLGGGRPLLARSSG